MAIPPKDKMERALASRIKALRVATLEWPRDDDGIADYANPKVIPLAVPREEYVFPPINPKTHRVIHEGTPYGSRIQEP